MQESLFAQGVDLMLYGMGTVFVFLGLLIAITTLISKVVQRLFPEALPVAKTGTIPSQIPAVVDAQTIRVIKAALDQHRARR